MPRVCLLSLPRLDSAFLCIHLSEGVRPLHESRLRILQSYNKEHYMKISRTPLKVGRQAIWTCKGNLPLGLFPNSCKSHRAAKHPFTTEASDTEHTKSLRSGVNIVIPACLPSAWTSITMLLKLVSLSGTARIVQPEPSVMGRRDNGADATFHFGP